MFQKKKNNQDFSYFNLIYIIVDLFQSKYSVVSIVIFKLHFLLLQECNSKIKINKRKKNYFLNLRI